MDSGFAGVLPPPVQGQAPFTAHLGEQARKPQLHTDCLRRPSITTTNSRIKKIITIERASALCAQDKSPK